MRKHAFCTSENKGADQLGGNSTADQHLCFRYIDKTTPLLFKSKISSYLPSFVVKQSSLCRTLWKTLKTGFLVTRFIYEQENELMVSTLGKKYISKIILDLGG